MCVVLWKTASKEHSTALVSIDTVNEYLGHNKIHCSYWVVKVSLNFKLISFVFDRKNYICK